MRLMLLICLVNLTKQANNCKIIERKKMIFFLSIKMLILIVRKVTDILKRKGSHVETVQSELTVIEALKLMADKNIGSIAIIQNEKFIGLMTERDYSRKVILKGRSSNETTVGEIMTSDYPSVIKNDTIEHCMELMSAKNIRYLPVIESGRLLGIISINDVVTETILTQKETIEHLHNYIHS